MYRNALLLLSSLGVSLTLIQFLLIPASASVEEAATKQQKSLMSERITVQAAGRGNPWIHLSDGRDVTTAYVGAAGLDQSRPLALAAADFDEDGVADLVSGYAGAGGGLLTMHRGNVDVIFPNSPEARQRNEANGDAPPPFLSPARVFETPEAPELLGTGDFDHDGHFDVVVTAAASNALYLLAGDGQGGLNQAQRIELPGGVTALATGEVNRADGLADVVVAVTGAEGSQLLVFESPLGALRGEPEVVALFSEARALALGQFDEEFPADVAVAAGHDLVLVQGRDRKLSLNEARQAEVPPTISQRALPFAVTLMTTGDFAGDERAELALRSDDGLIHLLSRPEAKGGKQKARGLEAWGVETLTGDRWPQATGLVCARVSSLPKDDLVVIDQASNQLRILKGDSPVANRSGAAIAASGRPNVAASLNVEGGPVAALPMRLNADALSDLVMLRKGQSAPTVAVTVLAATFFVNTGGDDGDNNPGDGVCEAGLGGCTLRAAIQEANASPGLDTIKINVFCSNILMPGDVEPPCTVPTIRPGSPLPVITGPVVIDGTEQRILPFAVVGRVQLSGSSAGGVGLAIHGGGSTVRGLAINNWSGFGIQLIGGGGNIIENNYIGADFYGASAQPNSIGVDIRLDSNNNIIGGTTPAARNVISGNNNFGVAVGLLGSSTGNLIQGNFIGANAEGTAAIPNGQTAPERAGIYLKDVTNSTIGGTTAGAGNVISGNKRDGVWIEATQAVTGSPNNVQGNYIGTNAAGTAALANLVRGVYILDAPNTFISGNVISGNNGDGIQIVDNGGGSQGGGANGNVVQGNFIGTDKDGAAAVPNFRGVRVGIRTNNNSITNNVISGNKEDGVVISGGPSFATSSFNYVGYNLIGVNAAGQVALPNQRGVTIYSDVDNTSIVNNVISGNKSGGVIIQGNSIEGLAVVGNRIGTNREGTVALANLSGVLIAAAGADISSNLISGNIVNGVTIQGGGATQNRLHGNLIGTDITGTADLGNSSSGVSIHDAPGNIIGGMTPAERNVISGNQIGVQIRGVGAIQNQVLGNFIGTDITGTVDLGNGGGVFITLGAGGNTIGGTVAGARNVISGNDASGINLHSSENVVQGNFIGTDVTGTAALGNHNTGVNILNAAGNTIGGTAAGAGNIIAFNGIPVGLGAGVLVTAPDLPTAGNAILSNSIFSNDRVGIDLGGDGVTANDANDADPGPNRLQNYPVLTSATSTASSTTIQGTLNSAANAAFRLEFFSNLACDPSGNGEGQSFIGAASVTTDAGGNASFNFTFPVAVAAGRFITATATDPTNNTSEFSQCLQVVRSSGLGFALTLDQAAVSAARGVTVRVTVNINRVGGFTGTVTVTPPDTSAIGVKVKPPVPVSTTGASASFKLKVKANAPPGPQQLVFTGKDDAGGTQSVMLTLMIQ